MKIIDARTGNEVHVGQEVLYDDSSGYKLISVSAGLFSARIKYANFAIARIKYASITGATTYLDAQEITVPVHYLHPAFPFQRVAFIPS